MHCQLDDLCEIDQQNSCVITRDYDFDNPPLRRNVRWQMQHVARSNDQQLRLESGINQPSTLMKVRSLKFNAGNLYDTIHVVLTNLAPNMIRLSPMYERENVC